MAASLVGLILGLAIALGIIGLFWPGWGLIPRWRRATKTAERVRVEDTMKHLYESEVNGVAPSMQSVAGAARLSVDEAADVLQRQAGLLRDLLGRVAGPDPGLDVLRAQPSVQLDLQLAQAGPVAPHRGAQRLVDPHAEPLAVRPREHQMLAVVMDADEREVLHAPPPDSSR